MATESSTNEPNEPRVAYINDILIELDAVFPNSPADEMPHDALEGILTPEDTPKKGY